MGSTNVEIVMYCENNNDFIKSILFGTPYICNSTGNLAINLKNDSECNNNNQLLKTIA